MIKKRDHGGGLDAAITKYGGQRAGWIDLSTGINPTPYPIVPLSPDSWTALPDESAFLRLERAARIFWNVPHSAAILAAPGASALIAHLPQVLAGKSVHIAKPTYNEHQAAFDAANWENATSPNVQVAVHPNNPDGRLWSEAELTTQNRIIDESFCDIAPTQSHIGLSAKPGTIVLKSFGKFWGLAGLRLGFAIGDPAIITKLRTALGPWQVSGPALEIGAAALEDHHWAKTTRKRLAEDANRLDALVVKKGASVVGGTDLFRLYETEDAAQWQDHLAQGHVWSRIFPYSKTWLRLGLPAEDQWAQLEAAL